MAVRSDETVLRLEGACPVEEAETLLSWLCAHPQGQVDLSACTHLHTALLQVLLAAGGRIAAAPEDSFYARRLIAPAGPLVLTPESTSP